MTNKNDGWGCRETSWLAAGIIGLVAAIILGVSADWAWLLAVLGGVVVAVLVGLILLNFFCKEADVSETVTAAPATDPAPAVAPVTAPEPIVTEPAAKPIETPVAQEAEPAVAEPVAEPAPEKPVEAAPAPVAPSVEGGEKPVAMAAARGGQPDDLKVIQGIGPKLEELCHSLGIYHFDQIAGWGANEVAWMDSNLPRFKGRVTRDNWVAQAKEIVEVGVDVYAERAKNSGK
ncbi:hypothetical protein BVC71_12280 [Marivivens niveibacter]|uniref:NADH:ubiquinone oxidoreductase n=1 Tax=Marivivens niveibacter TaxID=1930667 RepID=A0A251WWQ2_9RHOB|nr:hypothetical protein [Marivivens niveibacter]OUD08701.1 hypothetical protein BVC71_12280 [Marivivens niveibacter]